MEDIKSKLADVMKGMDLEAVGKQLKGITQNLPDMNQLKSLLDEHTKVFKPTSQKNGTFNGKNITIGLTTDNRVTISFASGDDAKQFYVGTGNIVDKKPTVLHKIKKLINKIKI